MDNKDFNRDQLLNEILRETAAPGASRLLSPHRHGIRNRQNRLPLLRQPGRHRQNRYVLRQHRRHSSSRLRKHRHRSLTTALFFQQCPVEYGSGVHRPAAGIGK